MTRRSAFSYSPELRERAARLFLDHAADHASQWTAIHWLAESWAVALTRCGAGFDSQRGTPACERTPPPTGGGRTRDASKTT
jgi:hypothetical protein